MSNKSKLFLIFFSLILISFFIPDISYAADLFDIPSGDKSKLMFMDRLFDSTSIETLEGSPLNHVISVFNTCVLMLGGVLAAYTLITGTISTAHEGEMLGKKWSAMWLPIRTTISAAFIFPTMGGFCIAQVIVIWLIHQGIGLADTLWAAYLDKMPSNAMTSAVGPDKNEVFNLAKGVLKSNYCEIVLDNYFVNNQKNSFLYKGDSYLPKTSLYLFTGDVNMSRIAHNAPYYYGYDSSKMTSSQYKPISTVAIGLNTTPNICGQVVFDTSSQQGATQGGFSMTSLSNIADASKNAQNASAISNSSQQVGSAPAIGSDSNINKINAIKISEFEKMNTTLRTAANAFYNADDKVKAQAALYNALNSATLEYYNQTKGVANKVFSESASQWDSIKNLMSQDGWMYAGSWYMQLYRVQTLLANISKTVPKYNYTGNITNAVSFGDEPEVLSPMHSFDSSVSSFSNVFNSGSSTTVISNEYKKNNSTETNTNPDDVVEELMGKIKQVLVNILVNIMEGSGDEASDDPIGFAFKVGNNLESAFWLIVAADAGGAAVPLVGGAFVAFAVLMKPFMSTIFLVSNLLTVVLPFMPFFLWLGAILGWAMLCIEAVLAAPLWIMIHMHPDGDGIVGRGGAGYGMVLSLTVRPALMILGLICAIICIQIFSKMVNEMFLTAFYTMASRDGMSILQFPIVVGTYAMALFIVMKKSFSLIHVIPDEILKWLGVNSHNSVGQASNTGLQTMMAAKQFDDMASKASPRDAIGALKEHSKNKNDAKDKLNESHAAEQIKGDNEKINSASNMPNSGSDIGKRSGFGDSISEQNSRADAAINTLSKNPTSSMSGEDKNRLRSAYQTKSDNLDSLLKSNALGNNSQAISAIKGEKEKVDNDLFALDYATGKNSSGNPSSSGDSGNEEDPDEIK